MLRCIWGHFLRVIQGTSPTLSHSSSLLHSLGSVTVRGALREDPRLSWPAAWLCPGACLPLEWTLKGWRMPSPLSDPHLSLQVLCCVDKQGILSWPNPSPETVLFFSGKVEPPHSSHEDLTDDLSTRSFCHPEVEEEVRPVPGDPALGPASGLREGKAGREKEGSGTVRICFWAVQAEPPQQAGRGHTCPVSPVHGSQRDPGPRPVFLVLLSPTNEMPSWPVP